MNFRNNLTTFSWKSLSFSSLVTLSQSDAVCRLDNTFEGSFSSACRLEREMVLGTVR
jgi:hypothetical protein